VATKLGRRTTLGTIAILAAMAAGCGDLVRQGRSPVQLVIMSLQAASGADPDEFGGDLRSDVITLVERQVGGETVRVPTVFNDLATVTLAMILKDPGQPGVVATPSAINQVTINRYRVTYRRTDGRNAPGTDVPFPFDSAVTLTVPADGSVTAGFQIVRYTAKEEAPLTTLRNNRDVISTIAEVTFFGRDQAGNEVSVSGNIGIDFGNFGDPD
jgi:hypothetical protein